MRQSINTFVNNSGLLVLGTVIALVWANLDRDTYRALADALHFGVNEIGMAFFFALATKEVVEATAPGGVLYSPRRVALPLAAAVGGMLGPALIFIGLTIVFDRPNLERGWAIPSATDIAFSFLAARVVFGAKHPVIPFLLLLALADDAMGLLIIAAFYPAGPLRPLDFFLFVSAAMLCAWLLKRRGTLNFWPYILIAGVLSWIGFYRGGLHPALALVPVIPFLPHAERDPGLFVEAPSLHDTLDEFEHWWKQPVNVLLFFFGLANAGVTFRNVGTGTYFVLIALLVGKPVGILTATALTTMGGLQLPKGVTWRDLIVVGIVAGIGFTVALFFATAAFPYGRLLDETKMGALLSVLAFGFGLGAARMLKVGRFFVAAAVSVALLSAGCKKTGDPTGPSPIPPANSAIGYTALGASDVIGFGASSFCIPYDDCANGKGYVQVAARDLRGRGFTVKVNPLGLPGAVLSRRILNLGVRYGRNDLLANIMDQEVPFILPTSTLITIFAGGNDVNVITTALGGGAGGADRPGYINSQVAAFGQDFTAALQAIRERAPSARIVVLNLPNLGAMPFLANAPRDHRLAAQMLSVGITTTVYNPLTSGGVMVLDLMCDARSYQAATYSGDGFHPSDIGYAWIAAEVVAATTTTYRAPAATCPPMTAVQ